MVLVRLSLYSKDLLKIKIYFIVQNITEFQRKFDESSFWFVLTFHKYLCHDKFNLYQFKTICAVL